MSKTCCALPFKLSAHGLYSNHEPSGPSQLSSAVVHSLSKLCTRPSQDYQFPDMAAKTTNTRTNRSVNNDFTPGSLTTQDHADQIYHLLQQGKPPTSLIYQAFYGLPSIFLGLGGLVGHDGQSCMPSPLGYFEFLPISHGKTSFQTTRLTAS